MRTLWSVAVFGLVPIPPADTTISSRDHLSATDEISDLSQPMITERMATKEELARIRAELEALSIASAERTRWRRVRS